MEFDWACVFAGKRKLAAQNIAAAENLI